LERWPTYPPETLASSTSVKDFDAGWFFLLELFFMRSDVALPVPPAKE
jgi:hypothetical protein